MPNGVEEQLGLDPTLSDTTGIWSGTPWEEKADQEILAGQAGFMVLGNKYADWSDEGLNRGTPKVRVILEYITR